MPKFITLTLANGTGVYVNPSAITHFFWAGAQSHVGVLGSGEGILKVKERPDEVAAKMGRINA